MSYLNKVAINVSGLLRKSNFPVYPDKNERLDTEARCFLQFNEYDILQDAGKVNHAVAGQLAEEEYKNSE